MNAMLLNKKVLLFLFLTLLVTASLWAFGSPYTQSIHASSAQPAENNGLAQTPFMGWSTWDYVGKNPTEANIEAQARVEASQLKSHGYNYVLLDDWYYLNPATTVDQYGRWAIDPAKFPHGIAAVASYVHGLGLKFGFYVTPGIPVAAVNKNTPIEGTSYHAKDIADTSKAEINYNFGGGTKHTVMYYINYSKPGAQAYINSWANQMASWGVDFLKIDGVGTFDTPDIVAWSQALKQSGRPIVYNLSNTLNVNYGSTWRTDANSWRIDGDVDCYNCGAVQTSWTHVSGRFNDAPKWVQYAGPGGWNDLDAIEVADGARDGISNTERQSMMTLWSIEAAPLYAGDDLTHMDSYGISLLTNDEVIAVDQAGHPAHPVSQSTSQQVWFSNNGDGTYTVALFNLGSANANVTANWSSLGISGSASVRDLWSRSNLGNFNGSFSATLPAHGSRLLKITSSGSVGTGCSSFSGYYHIINRNSGKYLDVLSDSTANNAVINQYASNGQTDQEWSFVNVGSGYCKIVNHNSGKLLNIPGPTTTQGTQLIQYSDDGNTNGQWSLTAVSGGYYNIVSRYDGQNVDIQSGSTANGAPVIQWPSNGGTNQQWQIVAG